MLRKLAISSLALAGLLAAAAVPAQAGSRTGSWKYWHPNMAVAAPPYWHKHHHGPFAGRGYGPPRRHGYGGHASPYGHAYGYRHGPRW